MRMTLTLRIRDNGVGIDPEVVEKGKEGPFGLRGMRERAERIGSKFTLVSSPDSGTVLTLVGRSHRLSQLTSRLGGASTLPLQS